MSASSQIQSYLRYRRHALSKHGVHSPFVFDLVAHVFPKQKSDDYSNHPAELWRAECLNNNSAIQVTDFGTGKSGPRKISEIAKRAAKKPKQGQLLHRILQHQQPEKMLELGTSLGITSLYEASATDFEKFISLEGCPETAKIARNAFQKYNFPVEVLTGEFDQNLDAALHSLGQVDYVYFDGNHQLKPTLHYFETCLPFAHNNSLFIFDDIHWSPEMETAWKIIRENPKVRLSIDLFHFGLVFFREEQLLKEDYILKF